MAGLYTGAIGLWGGLPGLISSTTLSTPPSLLANVGGIAATGANLALWFDENQAYKSSGGGIVTPDSILTYTAPSPKLVYGSDGVLGYAPHNLQVYSNDFANAAWTKNNCTVSSSGTAPDGSTATKLTNNTSNANHGVFDGLILAAPYSHSVYMKAGTAQFGGISSLSNSNCYAVFDLSDGTVDGSVGATAAITSVGDGWYRCSITPTSLASAFFIVSVIETSGVAAWAAYVGTTKDIYIWNAQASVGSSALTYIPTTTAAVYSLPRDYNPTTLAALGVLVEEARTNLCLYSDDFTNAAWVKSNLTAAKTATGPDGVANSASTLTATAANATARQDITSASAARITSMFVKRRTGTGAVYLSQGATTGSELVTNGTFASDVTGWAIAGSATLAWDTDAGAGAALVDITGAGGGIADNQVVALTAGKIYRVAVIVKAGTYVGDLAIQAAGVTMSTFNVTGSYVEYLGYFKAAASDEVIRIIRQTAATGTVFFNSISVLEVAETTVTVTSDWTRVATASATVTNPPLIIRMATSGDAIDVALFDHELGAFITSPIPTQASQVTRAADQISILTSAFPWTDAAGYIIADFTPVYADTNNIVFRPWILSSSATNYIRTALETTGSRTGQPLFDYRNSTSYTVSGGNNDLSPTNPPSQKWGFSYSAGSVIRAARNGATVGADVAVAVTSTPTNLVIGAGGTTLQINGHYKRFTYGAVLKSAAELQVLTS